MSSNYHILLTDYLPHDERVAMQERLFGKGHTPTENERFYRWVWHNKPHVCEECRKPLENYSAVHISHILSRGAHPILAHEPRNTNILCLSCHNRYENGDREGMRIYESNQATIERLEEEYYINQKPHKR